MTDDERTLDKAINWIQQETKCPHDGTASPCALCLIQEKNDKAEFIAILKRLMINAKEGT